MSKYYFYMIGGLAALFLARWGVWLVLRAIGLRRRVRQKAARPDAEQLKCAHCGYNLEGLEIPRCPECGALRGFTVPLDELGLTEEEIRSGFARRKLERAAAERAADTSLPPPDESPAPPNSNT